MDRPTAARIGKETLAVVEAGAYRAPSGRMVPILEAVARAVEGTVSHPPDEAVPAPATGTHATRVSVANETTLVAARRLPGALALNFASAKHPGGGFLNGAVAQEESLARSSALYRCLAGDAMYRHHERQRDAMYTDWAIYSPEVPVFRDDEGALLEEAWGCSFLTCAAVNARVVLERDPGRRAAIGEAMEARVDRVLALAAHHGHDRLVLGAWGCGVFGNEPGLIAGLFHAALNGPFRGVFAEVAFAILDRSGRLIEPFARTLA